MKIGLQIYHFDWPGSPENIGSRLVEIAKTAEDAGLSSLWVMDHLFQIGDPFGPAEAPMLEGYCTMSYLAAVTRRIKVGLMVTGNIYRHPGMLVKAVTTLDVLSGGRAYLGIGTGWYYREARGLGIPFPRTRREIIERLEETLQIVKQMWAREVKPFAGKHYQLAEPINSPQPLTQPHPPILVGGGGEKKTLRLVAKYADACNLHVGTPLPEFQAWMRELYQNRDQELTRKLKVLRAHCDEVGRPFDDIERTVLATIKLAPGAMSAGEVVELCRGLARIGFQHVIFNMPNVHEIKPLEILGTEVVPAVANV